MAKAKISFEEAMERLEEIVSTLENEEVSLENSIKLYKEGVELSSLCQKKLSDVESEIKKLQKNQFGNIEEVRFDNKED